VTIPSNAAESAHPGAAPKSLVGRPARIGAALIGAQKAGTTSLATVLARHPDICLAAGKEAHLFDRPEVQRRGPRPDELETFFGHRRPGQVLLDATPSYLYLPGCVEALVRHEPHVRIVVVLRPPVSRAVSHHAHEVRLGYERRSLLMAIALERHRLRRDADPLAADSAHRHSSYVDRSRYDVQLRRLRESSVNVHVVHFDELVLTPIPVVQRIFDFLGLDPIPAVEFPHLNQSGRARHRLAESALRLLTRRSDKRTEQVLAETGWGS
jgi:hypothetical protein